MGPTTQYILCVGVGGGEKARYAEGNIAFSSGATEDRVKQQHIKTCGMWVMCTHYAVCWSYCGVYVCMCVCVCVSWLEGIVVDSKSMAGSVSSG